MLVVAEEVIAAAALDVVHRGFEFTAVYVIGKAVNGAVSSCQDDFIIFFQTIEELFHVLYVQKACEFTFDIVVSGPLSGVLFAF